MKRLAALLMCLSFIVSLAACQESGKGTDGTSSLDNSSAEISETYTDSEQGTVPDKADGGETTLEFWITEDVKDVDWSEHDEIFGWMGAREFLGKDYKKIIGEDGTNEKPAYYVSYLITAYPDYADGGEFVTSITVTDPDVKVYGLTVNSTFEEFDSVFESLGFALSDGQGAIPSRIAEKDGITFRLDKPTAENEGCIPTLHISAEVTNRQGIVF